MSCRNYCFTSFKEDFKVPESEDIKYCVFQKEQAPDTGRIHYQGYIELTKTMRISGLKTLLEDNTLHAERRNGTREQAREYCMKEATRQDGPWEIGIWTSKAQGKRSDLDSLEVSMKENASIDNVIENHFGLFIKYGRGIQNASFILRKRKAREFRVLETHVYWGDAGAGKTRAAVQRNADYYILEKTADTLWFDNYDGELSLIIDDFYGWIPFNTLLRILDGYMFKCPIKGGFVYALWTEVTITSNKPWTQWYKNLTHRQEEALARRIHYQKEYLKE